MHMRSWNKHNNSHLLIISSLSDDMLQDSQIWYIIFVWADVIYATDMPKYETYRVHKYL